MKKLENLYKIIEFSKYGDDRGSLVVLEGEYQDIPFDIKRVFFIYVNDITEIRGKHANRETELVLVSARGKCKVKVSNGFEEKVVELSDSKYGLYIAPMCWKEMYDFSNDAVLLVVASKHYSAEEYIDNMEAYRAEMKEKFGYEYCD